MSKYLDLTGLTKYNAKIKNYADGKAEEAEANAKTYATGQAQAYADMYTSQHNGNHEAHKDRFLEFVQIANLGLPNSAAALNANGKIGLSQIPDAVLGQVEYLGQWNAGTGAASGSDLRSPAGRAYRKGDYFVCSAAGNKVPKADGTEGSVTGDIDYAVGDWLIYTTDWEKVDNTDAVTSVCGRTGAVTVSKADVGLANVVNSGKDTNPTSGSANYVSSGGVYAALQEKQNKLTFDTAPTAGSSNPVTSGGVKTALNAKQDTMTAITTAEINALFA